MTSEIDPIYKELATRIKEADDEYIPRILAKLAGPEQARILQALPDKDRAADAGRSLEVSEAFAEKLGMSKETVAAHIKELFEKGVVFPTRGRPVMRRLVVDMVPLPFGIAAEEHEDAEQNRDADTVEVERRGAHRGWQVAADDGDHHAQDGIGHLRLDVIDEIAPDRIVLDLPIDLPRPRRIDMLLTPHFVKLKARLLSKLGRGEV